MTISDSTHSVLAAQAYIQKFVTLDEKGFADLLTEDVVCSHTRLKDGTASEPKHLQGKTEVLEAYRRHFFSITSNIELKDVHYLGAQRAALIDCDVSEDKLEWGVKRRYFLISRIQLTFQESAPGALKVAKIFECTSKELLP